MSDLIEKVKEAFNKTPAHLEDFTRVGAERAIKVILQALLTDKELIADNRGMIQSIAIYPASPLQDVSVKHVQTFELLVRQFAQRHNIDIGEGKPND